MVGVPVLPQSPSGHEKLAVPVFAPAPDGQVIARSEFIGVAPENGDPLLPHAAWRYLVDRSILDAFIKTGAGQRAPVYYKYWGLDLSMPSGLEFADHPGEGEKMWEYSQFDGLRAARFGAFVTRTVSSYNEAEAQGYALQELFGHTIFGNGRARPMLDHLLHAAVELLPPAEAAA